MYVHPQCLHNKHQLKLTQYEIQDCDKIVASKFFPIDGTDGRQQPLCERDYFRRLNLICAKCGMALRGSYITACSACSTFLTDPSSHRFLADKKFHVEHFTCSLCPTLFGPQDSYYEHDGDVYCHFHYSTRFATKCAGCSSAILKQFVEINRNMRDECWHPECYMINKVRRQYRASSTILTFSSSGTSKWCHDGQTASYRSKERMDTWRKSNGRIRRP